MIATIEKGQPTTVEWRKLPVRPVIDRRVTLTEDVLSPQERLLDVLGPREALAGALVRLTVSYPQVLESAIDDAALRNYAAEALEFHLVKRPQVETRARLGDEPLERLTHAELLEKYFLAKGVEAETRTALLALAREILEPEAE